jgi:hypothetical protein
MGFVDANWLWIAGGLALLGLETILPGIFLFWIGLAAIAAGLLVWVFPLDLTGQLIAFAALGLGTIVVGRRVQGDQNSEVTDSPFLNERGREMLGKVFTLETAIVDGAGSVKVGDSVWRVVGADLAKGEKVKVTGIDGATLKVEPA